MSPRVGVQQEQAPQIERPDFLELNPNLQIQRALEKKLEEYDARKHGGIKSDYVMDARYKSRILTRLLHTGSVTISQIKDECIEDFGDRFRLDLFENAAQVIYKYNSYQFSEKVEKVPVLTLNQDPNVQMSLFKKRTDYASRLNPGVAPEEQDQDARYKHMILDVLIETGSVDTDELMRTCLEKEGQRFQKDVFKNACNVIAVYNKGTTDGLRGGTGI